MKSFVKVMKALADPNRAKIIKMLQYRTVCVCELQAALHVAQPTVSKYLKLLEDAGLVAFKKEGLWVNYRLTDGNSVLTHRTLQLNLNSWIKK